MTRAACAIVFLSAVPPPAYAQPLRDTPAPSTQALGVSGRVLADETGDPVANARVTLVSATPGAPVVLTDRDGRFTLGASAGPHTVVANKSGYSRRQVVTTTGDQPIEIRLSRAAAISGRVVNEFGDPIIGARVAAGTAPQPPATGFTAQASTNTDDRGEYRLGSLTADTFVVEVTTRGALIRQDMGGGATAMFPSMNRTYFPRAATATEGEPLLVRSGEELSSIDFVVHGGQWAGSASLMVPAFPLARPAATDSAARSTGVIRGQVVSTDGRAVPRAEVRIVSPVRAVPNVTGAVTLFPPTARTADDDGRFEFQELPAGSFLITAAKVGYSTPGESFSLGPPPFTSGLAVQLAGGEMRDRADIRLAPWGSLEGHVLDELGDPLQGVSVQVMQIRYQAGRRRLVPAGAGSGVTDDLGRFRLYGIAPGQYIVSAAIGDVASTDLPGYARSYYPGTPNASEAQFVSIRLSQQMTGADFSLSRTRTARVSGRLLSAAGEPTMGGGVRLLTSARSAAVTRESVGARILPDGRFEFPNVAPGQYVIQADRGRPKSSVEGEFGMLPVSVEGSDVKDLILQMSAGSTIGGRVTFDSSRGGTVPRPSQIEITPVPTDPDLSPRTPANADVHQDWSFEISGVNGPRRLQLTRTPAEWSLKEIRVGGIDVTDQPLAFGRTDQSLADVEVVLTDRIAGVSGTIVDDHGKPAAGSHLVVFSTDRGRWYATSRYLREAAATTDGAIVVSGLPAGSYYAAAVAQLPADGQDAWQDPAYLESLMPRASSFTLGDGQKQTINLRVP